MNTEKSEGIERQYFSVNVILKRSFFVFRKSPFVFISFGFLAMLPSVLINLLTDSFSAREGVELFLTDIVVFILYPLVLGATTYGVTETLRGNVARFGKSISAGLVRIGPLILAALFILISMLVVGIVLFLFLQIAWTIDIWLFAESNPQASELMGKIFFFAFVSIFIVVFAFLSCKWGMSTPACVVERLGPIKSLKRSSEITKGFRLKIFGVYLLCLLISSPFALFSPICPLMDGITSAFITSLGLATGAICFSVLSSIITAVPTAIGFIAITVIYCSLLETKEGIPIDRLENAFEVIKDGELNMEA